MRESIGGLYSGRPTAATMRLAPLLVLFLAEALHAQAVPDTTAPWRYYPLHVGDVWDSADDSILERVPYVRREVVKDTVADGRTYAVVRTRAFRRDLAPVGDGHLYERYDTTQANIELRDTAGNTFLRYPCRLDSPFGAECASSGGTGPGAYVDGAPRVAIRIDETTVETAVKGFGTLGDSCTLAAGIGELGCYGDASSLRPELVYARVAGVEYGAPLVLENVPDTTPPSSYYPLAVGTRQEYKTRSYQTGTEVILAYERREIVRDTLIGGTAYAIEERRRNDGTTAFSDAAERLVLRFDPATKRIVRWQDGTEQTFVCDLDASLGSRIDCDAEVTAPDGSAEETGAYGLLQYIRIGTQSVPGVPAKRFARLSDPPPEYFSQPAFWLAGFGESGWYSRPDCPGCITTLEYVRRVEPSGVVTEFGTRVPVASEAAPGASVFALAAAPNPTAGPLSLSLTLPEAQTVRLEAFDALGRRVWHLEAPLGAGPQRVAVDASAWAPGLYVVRATAGRASAATRVVRR